MQRLKMEGAQNVQTEVMNATSMASDHLSSGRPARCSRRQWQIFSLMWLNKPPCRPPTNANTKKNGNSQMLKGFLMAGAKEIRPEYDAEGSATIFHKFKKNVPNMEHKNTIHVSCVLQKELASSSENRIPPTGAPKAAATPAAAPPDTKSRLSRSFRKRLIQECSQEPLRARFPQPVQWLTLAAMTAPECTSGPSLPIARPADTENTTPMHFTSSVGMRRKRA